MFIYVIIKFIYYNQISFFLKIMNIKLIYWIFLIMLIILSTITRLKNQAKILKKLYYTEKKIFSKIKKNKFILKFYFLNLQKLFLI